MSDQERDKEIERLHQKIKELEASAKYWKELSNSQTLEIERRKYWEKDVERLEFVIKNFTRAVSVDMSGKHAWTGIGRLIGYGNNPREAIDAARKVTK